MLHFKESVTKFEPVDVRVAGDRVTAAFRTTEPSGAESGTLELSGQLIEDRLLGEARWDKIGWTPLSGRRRASPLPTK